MALYNAIICYCNTLLLIKMLNKKMKNSFVENIFSKLRRVTKVKTLFYPKTRVIVYLGLVN